MKTTQNDELLRLNQIENGVGKSLEHDAVDIFINERSGERLPYDPRYGCLYAARELKSQARSL